MAELNLVQKRKQKSVYTMLVLFGIFTTIFYLTSKKTEAITFGFILGNGHISCSIKVCSSDRDWRAASDYSLIRVDGRDGGELSECGC